MKCCAGCAHFQSDGHSCEHASVGEEVRRGTSPMAPQYAPSLRSRLTPLLLSLQIGFVVVYAFYTEIESNIKEDEETFSNLYAGEW